MSEVRKNYPFHIDAIVIIPEHLHAIWTLPPEEDDDFSKRWMLIKGNFFSFPSSAWECMYAQLRCASSFGKQSLQSRIPKQELGNEGNERTICC